MQPSSIPADRSSATSRASKPIAVRLRSRLKGGPDGNEQLTAATGVVLIILLAVLGITIIRIGQLIWLHLFLGLLLIGPVALKMGSTGYRFVLYYVKDASYRRKGPPETWLRLIAPIVVADHDRGVRDRGLVVDRRTGESPATLRDPQGDVHRLGSCSRPSTCSGICPACRRRSGSPARRVTGFPACRRDWPGARSSWSARSWPGRPGHRPDPGLLGLDRQQLGVPSPPPRLSAAADRWRGAQAGLPRVAARAHPASRPDVAPDRARRLGAARLRRTRTTSTETISARPTGTITSASTPRPAVTLISAMASTKPRTASSSRSRRRRRKWRSRRRRSEVVRRRSALAGPGRGRAVARRRYEPRTPDSRRRGAPLITAPDRTWPAIRPRSPA